MPPAGHASSARQAPLGAAAKPANCATLLKVRDTTLAQDVGYAISRYTAATKSLEVLAPLKREALEQLKTSPKVDAAIKLSLALKTAANAVGDILGISPATEAASASATGFAGIVLSKQTDLSLATLSGDLDSWVKAEALAMVPVIGAGLKATYNFYGNLQALKEADLDGKTIAAENARNIATLENLLHKQEALLKDSDWRVKMINEARATIDKRCN